VSALTKALLVVQKEAPKIQKTAINPHFRSKYVSLETLTAQVLPILNAHGLVLLQEPTALNGVPALRTRLIHAETGEETESTMFLVLAKQDPQGQGSALTYARRYALMSVLGLVADADDDGERASAPKRANETAAITKAQHGKIGALVKELASNSPPEEGTEHWASASRAWIDEQFGKKSRADLTKAEAGKLIEHLEGQLEAIQVPFG
jgi:hypothetical protein